MRKLLNSLCLVILASTGMAQVTFQVTYSPDIPAEVRAGVENSMTRVTEVWSSYLQDEATLRVEIGWEDRPDLSRKALGQIRYHRRSFAEYRDALRGDLFSISDLNASVALPAGDMIPVYINRTGNNPNGAGSAIPYLDDNNNDNNEFIRLPFALEKAVGLLSPTNMDTDGTIIINGSKDWDFDSSDGVSEGAFELEVTLLHEVGHILGFTSRNDSRLAAATGLLDFEYDYLTPMDLFTFSAESLEAGGIGTIDWCADDREKFISIDGGATSLGPVSTGVVFGDGFTRGHWQNVVGAAGAYGIMDPATSSGQVVLDLDLVVLDIIGWEIQSQIVTVRDLAIDSLAEMATLTFDRPPWANTLQAYTRSAGVEDLIELSGTVNSNVWAGSLSGVDPNSHLLISASRPLAARPGPALQQKAQDGCAHGHCGCHVEAIDLE